MDTYHVSGLALEWLELIIEWLHFFLLQNVDLIESWMIYFCVEAYHPRQQLFSHVGTEPTLPGFNQYCRELMCLAQGHNTMSPVGIEPGPTSRFGVRRSTTTPPRSLVIYFGYTCVMFTICPGWLLGNFLSCKKEIL